MAFINRTPGILVLKEGTERETKKDAFEHNMAAAMAVADAVRSTLGPKGLDKLLVDSLGDITITNDGATILKEIDIQHPAAKMMLNVAETQDDEVGDGTTTSVILAGAILRNMNELIQGGVHPSIIARGVAKARNKCLEILDEISEKIDISDRKTLQKVVSTSMNSKVISLGKDKLSSLALDAILTLRDAGVENLIRNINKIKIVKKEGGDAIDDTKLVKGIIIDKEIVHSQMPRRVKDAKIALLGFALEVKKTEFDAKITIKSPEQIASFLEEEEKMLESKVQKLVDAGVNVLLSQKSIDDVAIHYLKKAGILAVKSIDKKDLDLIAEAVGGKVLNSLDEMSPDDLGSCEIVHEEKIGDTKYVFIEGCSNPRAITILIRGEGGKGLDEAERGLHDALCVAASIVRDLAITGGGGAVEVELSKRLNEYAKTFSGREQLVIEQFANALEEIPLTLIENAGLDAIESLGALKAAHQGDGKAFMGFNLYTNKVEDMREAGIVEPVSLVKTAIKTASEVAMMIIRIDDVIKAGKLGE